MLLCCALLCMTLLLFCGSAFAAVDVQNTDSTVTVTKSADETQFTVRKEGVTDGQFYLVMIQQGDASALPTSENLYYLNVYTASGTTFEQTVYPKDLTEGNYAVFLSDYSGTGNGARAQVATLTVGDSGGGGGSSSGGGGGGGSSSGGGTATLCGDVDGNGTINGRDLTALARYCAENSDYMPGGSRAINMQNANCNGDANGTVNGRDLTSLARHLAEVAGYEVLPH
ncbi:MAG: dockerin type I repeat-containing protein [Oscillibacter sp.]|nr:dockerin type I repeat-containing protein [Oscillibacter sp.]MBQ9618222.1 dockerin type I repeat-containing protein [Oscillibacter sp.]